MAHRKLDGELTAKTHKAYVLHVSGPRQVGREYIRDVRESENPLKGVEPPVHRVLRP